MRFFKYQAAGNDFILIDNRGLELTEAEKSALAKPLCHRHFGIGGDGLLFVEASEIADARMRIFNPDGTEAEMCGNGIRCVGRFLYDTGRRAERMLIETLAGVKELHTTVERGVPAYFEVDMGSPRDVALKKKLRAEDRVWEYCYLDTGVPHAIIFQEDVESLDVGKVAPPLRHSPVFPRGANINFVEKMRERVFRIRTFERGVERETLACGTGITAAGAAAVFLGLADEGEELSFNAPGGRVFVKVVREGREIKVFMKGPAEPVFQGEIDHKRFIQEVPR